MKLLWWPRPPEQMLNFSPLKVEASLQSTLFWQAKDMHMLLSSSSCLISHWQLWWKVKTPVSGSFDSETSSYLANLRAVEVWSFLSPFGTLLSVFYIIVQQSRTKHFFRPQGLNSQIADGSKADPITCMGMWPNICGSWCFSHHHRTKRAFDEDLLPLSR